MPTDLCPCGSKQTYSSCCDLYHSKQQVAPTAEKLMRSRYTAFAKGLTQYLLETRHPDTRAMDSQAAIQDTIDRCQWINLTIESTEAGQLSDTEGYVTFVANFVENGKPGSLKERSFFKKVDDRWYYVEGSHEQQPAKKIGRNDPCWCGSGKKFKKCHG